MRDETSPRLRLLTVLAVGCALMFVGTVWLVVLAFGMGDAMSVAYGERAKPSPTIESIDSELTPIPATPAAVGPTPIASPTSGTDATVEAESTVEPDRASWGQPILLDTDLGSGSQEFSAITLNESTNRVMIADDQGWLYEFDLAPDGQPVVPPRRALQVTVGAGDIEGLAWMFDSTYVLAHENDGQLTVVEIDDDAEMVGDEHLVRTVDTGIRENVGYGLEGVAYIAESDSAVEFVVVQERPPTVMLIGSAGNLHQRIPIGLGLSDLSDVWVDSSGNFHLLSDEGRVVVTVALDASGEAATLDVLHLTIEPGRFEQPEGLAGTADGSRLFVVGESPGVDRFSFAVWDIEPAGG